jgi:hypothetical protein
LDAHVEVMSSSVVAAMRGAHERLMRAVYEAARAVRAGQRDARHRFFDFSVSARRHLAGEEHYLFPLLQAHGGDVSVLGRDHRQLADALGRAEDALDRGALADFYDIAQELMVTLSAHRIREERLFVASANAIWTAAPPQLVERLRSIFTE